MLGVLGLATGWVLLSPLLLLIYVGFGRPIPGLLAPVLQIASSAPLLAFFTLGGLAMIVGSTIVIARGRETHLGPY